MRDDLLEKEHQLTYYAQQASAVDEMDAKVKYVYESKKETDLSNTESTYQEIAGALYQVGLTSKISSLAIYDMDGDLIAYFKKVGEASIAGFRVAVPAPAFHFVRLNAGEQLAPEAWKKSAALDELGMTTRFEGTLPQAPQAFFQEIDRVVSLVAHAPVIGVDYSSGKPEDKQFGFTAAIQQLDDLFVTKMAGLTGIKINLFGQSGAMVGSLKEYGQLEAQISQTAATGWQLADQPVALNDIDLNSGGWFQGVLPLIGPKGHTGTVAALYSKQRVKENTWQIIRLLGAVYLACLLIIIPLTLLFSRSLTRPILKIVDGLTDISQGEGDLTRRLEVKGKDEIATLATSFNEFVEKLQGMIRNVIENALELNASAADLSALSGHMTRGAGDMSSKSNAVAASAEEMSANMASVAGAMEEASSNINMVASSTEEMTATVNEIAQNSEKARNITQEAVSQSGHTSGKVDELGRAAQEISKVTETITEISEQTNLLALNATIEAARAGEAGKGFAVVANEIKELARQTAGATQEIKKRIEGIQNTTRATVVEIGQISKVINGVNEIVSTIATAVEEQAVTTRDIAGNVSMASQKIQEVNENVAQSSSVSVEIAKDITVVNQSAGEISESSTKANESTAVLTHLTEQLKSMMNRFKI